MHIDIDDTDRDIINVLKRDGRMSAKDIAKEVGLTPVTVRTRIKSLKERGLLNVVAVADFEAAGFGLVLAIGIEVERIAPHAVAKTLTKFDRVLAVNVTTGAVDIEMLVVAHDMADLAHFLFSELGEVNGIGKLHSAIALEVFKHYSDTVVVP